MNPFVFKKEEFFSWLETVFTKNSVAAYKGYLNKFVKECDNDKGEMTLLKAHYEKNLVDDISNQIANWCDKVDNCAEWDAKSKSDVKSGLRKYIEFILGSLNNTIELGSVQCDEASTKQASPLASSEETYSETEIRTNFNFRITTQDRFGTYDIVYPISMIKSLSSKRGDQYKKRFEALIDRAIDSIKIYSASESYPLSMLEELRILSSGESVIELKNGFSFVLYGYSADGELKVLKVPMNLNDPIKGITIEHETSMKTLLSLHKEKLPILASLSHLRSKNEASALLEKGEFDLIDLDMLLDEVEFVMNSSELALMDGKENIKKSSK